MEALRQLFPAPPDRSTIITISATIFTTLAVLSATRAISRGRLRIIKSPATTLLPTLSKQEIAELPYPPDAYPGARDVDTPYGSIRVYEWGPEDGRKVLLVHGITTPCVALGAVARGLVEKGCRVMLMDLWGRGYTDTCGDLEHDNRLYSTEILMAVTSSPLSWIGGADGGFSLIGYSLGGGISVAFTSYFSHMVNSLVLLAPSGLIRPEHMSGRTKFLFSTSFLPESILEYGVKMRLRSPLASKKADKNDKPTLGDAVTAEMKAPETSAQSVPLSQKYPAITVLGAVQWQVRAHDGFVNSFMSSIRFAPISGQNAIWETLSKRPSKTLIIAGKMDPIILYDELKSDAMKAIGAEKIEWKTVHGTHDFPSTLPEETLQGICEFWGL